MPLRRIFDSVTAVKRTGRKNVVNSFSVSYLQLSWWSSWS